MTNMAASQLAQLFQKILDNSASAEERTALQTMMLDPVNEPEFKALLGEALLQGREEIKMDESSAEQILEVIAALDKPSGVPVIVPILQRFRWAVAAAAIVIVFTAGWWLLRTSSPKSASQDVAAAPIDIAAPARSQAILTLASGEKILLDSIGTGIVTADKGVRVTKGADGRIVYAGSDQPVLFNTISLPKGSRPLQLVLADGSIAWLNAASSITYPTAFTGKNRQVTIEGEAYFEVAHDAERPFILHFGETMVEVLGTHFNVKSYGDEPSADVTLLEGRVRVYKKDQERAAVFLQPGQQAVVSSDIQLITDADTDLATAWRRGYFALKGADIPSVMRQISRWYNVDVQYDGPIPDRKFVGSVSRDISLQDLIQSLKEYGIEGRLEHEKLVLKMKDK